MSEVSSSWLGWADSATTFTALLSLNPRGRLLSSQENSLEPWAPAVLSWHLPPSETLLLLHNLPLIGGSLLRWRREPPWTMTAVYTNGGGLVNPHYARWDRRDSVESGCQAESSKEGEEGQPRQLTPFEKLTQDMSQDEKVVREITLGKRIGFYRIRGEIGSGNFSQVKLGIHSLTKGRIRLPKGHPWRYWDLV